jgi:hypothetical protein
MAQQIQLRNGTAAQWASANPTLAVGEIGVETDTSRFKVGTGSTAWTSLSYVSGIGSLPSQTGNSGKYLTTDGTVSSWGTVSSGDVVLVRTASFSGVANTSTTFDGVFTSTYKSYKVVVRQFYGNSPSTNPVLNLRSGGATNVQGNYNVMFTKVVGANNSSSTLGQYGQTYWDLPHPWTALSAQSSYYMDWTGVGFSNYEVLVSMSGLGNGSNTWWTGGYRWEGSATTFDGFIITAAGGTTITGTVDVYGYK